MDSVAIGNAGAGFHALATNGRLALVSVLRSAAIGNDIGVRAEGLHATAAVSQSNLEASVTAPWAESSRGTVASYGDNYTGNNPAARGVIVYKN